MVSSLNWKSVVAGVVFVGLGATVAYASADDAIKGRQGCMKAHAATVFGYGAKVMKGEMAYDAAKVQELIAAESAACADWANFWGADTQKGETLETYAKPEVWTDAAGFEAAGGAWYKAFQVMQASTDEASFKAAVPAVGAACQGCHEKFQRPKG